MNKVYIDSWIDIAITDLEVSKVLFEKKMYSNSFYHFQQASEKGLKAYAFMSKIFTKERDSHITGHHTLEIFKDSLKKRQDEIELLKQYNFESLIGTSLLNNYSDNLKTSMDNLPSKKGTPEYPSIMLDEILKTIQDLKGFSLEFPDDFKFFLIEKMNLFFDILKDINPEKVEEAKNEFYITIGNEEQFDEFLKYFQKYFNSQMNENYFVLILYFSNLISHNHNQKARYPEINFNPLNYYNLDTPIIKKLPEFTGNLFSALLSLKKWSNLINPTSN